MINIDALNDDEKLAALESIHKSIAESKEIQKKKITTNVELIVKALKKIESDLKQRYDETGQLIANLKNGEDGRDGKDGKDGKNGKDGRDGLMGPRGYDGVPGRNGLDGADGVSVTDAHIDFDGSLIISLSSGRVINVGEVVAADIAEKIKVITNGGGTSQGVLDAIASLQAQIDSIASGLEYQGTWNASTNVPTLASSVGTAGYYYIVSTAGSTNLNGVTDWQVGDWAVFNGTVWQKIDQTNLVTSVAGRTGAIVLTTTDIGGLGTIATQAASNVSITGGSITGITDLAIADGGTGASTAAAAITALTGTQTSGFYLRSNGTGAFLSAIQAGDVPTLNQSTTGSAGSLSTTLVTSSGGTGLTSFTNKGVLYASSTSTLATGTALQFDGTNFAVGTTPSAFGSTFRSVEVGDLASLSFESSGVTKKTHLSTNSYNATNTGARPYYKANGLATEYSQNVGEHAWYTAPTGIAGSSTTITTGKIYTNLTVGNQTDFGAPSNAIGTIWTATSSGTLSSGTVVQNIDFVESMRIDASSNVGIGISTPGSKLDVKGTLRLSGSTSGYVGLAPASAAGSTTYTLPSADGTNGQSLTTNGSGTLSWASGTGGTVTSVAMTVPSFLSVSGSPITSSGTLAVSLSGTALPVANGGTGITSFGTGVATFLGTPSSANLAAAVTDETGSGALVFATSPTLVTPALGTPSSGVVTNLTGTASININGTVGATTPASGAFTTLAASGAVTLSGGTANGVAYLNGSKVVTSGSALTFNGTTLGAGLIASSTTQNTDGQIRISNTTTRAASNKYGIRFADSSFETNASIYAEQNGSGNNAAGLVFGVSSGTGGVVLTSATEGMRLTSTGLGIGTSSPARKLQVKGTGAMFNNASGAFELLIGDENYRFFGLYTPSSPDYLSIRNGTTDIIKFDALLNNVLVPNGNVGIGTSSPSSILHVKQTAGSATITVDYNSTNVGRVQANSNGNMYLGLTTGSGSVSIGTTSASDAIYVASGGNIGVGTTSPTVKLDVSSAVTNGYTPIVRITRPSASLNDQFLGFYNGIATDAQIGRLKNSDNLLFGFNSGVSFSTSMTLNTSGNLGLGVAPTSTWATNRKVLQLGGSAGTVVAFNGTSGSGEQFYNSYFNTSSQNIYNTTTYAGKTDFNIASAGGFTWQLAPSGTAGNAITFTQAMTLDASGNLLLGQTARGLRNSNSFEFSVSDASIYQNHITGTSSGSTYTYFGYNATSIGSITQSGTTAVLYNTTSDQRLKENIVDAPEFGSVIDSIKVRSYDWKSDGSHQRAGFVAQELVTVAPEAVHQPEDSEEMMAVDYSKLVPMLVKEIQSLRKRLADAGI